MPKVTKPRAKPAATVPAPAPTAAHPPLRVLGVASEMYPLLKTGGLADVAGALPGALAPLGVQVCTLVPGHPAVLAGLQQPRELAQWPGWFGGTARLVAGRHGALELLVLDAPHLYDRPGNPYLDGNGRDWADNAERYAALAFTAARIGWGDVPGVLPDLLHAHDWQAALVPAYQHYLGAGRRRVPSVLTLHNLAFQGQFKADIWSRLGLPAEAFAMQGLEYHGDVGYLKAGIHFADAITTVSPTYAHEIRTLSGGMGLDDMLRWRGAAVSGIVNGIDTDIWNPASDPLLAQAYDAERIGQRQANKRAVEAQFGLPPDDSPLVCMVSRLTAQKGIDLVAAVLDAIVHSGARLVVLGTGDAALQDALRAGAQRHPTRVAVRIGYDEGLSHLLQGGSDAILVPSRFEPCGLTQLYGLRYGCVPVVARVGGLADTVIDANDAAVKAGVATGLQFSDITANGLLEVVRRMVQLYRQPAVWARMQQAGMRADVGWASSAEAYAALYRRLVPAGRLHERDRTRLDALRAQVQAILLSRQDPTTGLLPASTAITVHGDYTHAWVRDNVYSILAVWALGLAYRRVDAEAADALDAAVVRLMRGLLHAMQRQAHKVERFKHTQSPMDALHAKYDTATGAPVVGDADWGHLQIDATALFVLQLRQMSESGLAIVQTPDEVAFVQNLVWYLAKAWRTPDYGIWERGHKRNEGAAELNASSLGMAKAALQAIDGFEPLPGQAPPVLVLADDVAAARATLHALLPRESASKETDAALLAIVGYPAFAVDKAPLAERTRERLLAQLQGRYGCKRFLRDGHQTVLEDHGRLYYTPGELQQFAHIESEWPLFFTYLLVGAALDGDAEQALQWRERLQALTVEQGGQQLLPELYIVPAEAVDAERAAPQSQDRVPNVNVPLVWAQSLYLVGLLLQEGHVTPAQIDPLGRRHAGRAVLAPTVQLALLAEDGLVAARLAAQGLIAQGLEQLGPLQVRDAAQLAGALGGLGRCEALGLTGRPLQPLGTLATARLFVQGTERIVCLPAFGRQRGFYLGLDNRLLADELAGEIAQLRRHWHHTGQPLLALLLTRSMLDAPGADELVAALVRLSSAEGVDSGPLRGLLPRVAVCRLPVDLEWPAAAPPATAPPAALQAWPIWEEAATRTLTVQRVAMVAQLSDEAALLAQLAQSRNPYEQAELLAALWRRAGPQRDTGLGGDVRALTQALYARACRARRWGVMRRAAGLLQIHDEALEDAVAAITLRGKRIALGRAYSAGSVVAQPLSHAELLARLQAHGGDDHRGRVLIEELVLLLALLLQADPPLFHGTMTLRPWQSLLLLTGWLAREHGVSQAEALDHVLDLSPHAIAGRLREVIGREQDMRADLRRVQTLHATAGALAQIDFAPEHDPVLRAEHGGWTGWRELNGVIVRLPESFHASVWALLQHCAGLVIGDQLDPGNRLDSLLVRADTTPGEHSFALQVEELLERIHAPAYRQLCVETLQALSEIVRANPGLRLHETLVLDVLIGHAVALGWRQDGGTGAYNEQVAQAWDAFYARPPHAVSNLVMGSVALLMAPQV